MVWAVVGAVAVSAGVSLYEGSQNRALASGIANTQANMQGIQFNEQQQYASQLQNLIANPSQVTSLPGYQFMFDQGQQALQRGSAAKGFLNSGNEGTALVQYGEGYANQALTQQEQLLASLSGLQPAVQGNPVGAVNASTNAQNSSNAQLNNLLSQLGLAAGSFRNLGSSGSPTITDPNVFGGGTGGTGFVPNNGGVGFTSGDIGWGAPGGG